MSAPVQIETLDTQTVAIESKDSDRITAAISSPSFIVASYNIRYAVGQFLISTGLLRKVGYNLPQPRAERVAENIANAASAFASGSLLPRVDILALQEADKGTVPPESSVARAGEPLEVFVTSRRFRGVPPAPRHGAGFENKLSA